MAKKKTGRHLEKLKITAFKKNGKFLKDFLVLINPEKIKVDQSVDYREEQGLGTREPHLRFQHVPSKQVAFSLIFDGTGLVNTASNEMRQKSVTEQIDEFKTICIKYQPDNHKPNFLRMTWGQASYRGYLTSLSIEYKLFKPDGTPLRAEAAVTFKTSGEYHMASKTAKKSSPDLTHTRIVKANNRLPEMCNNIYDGVNYYIQVAKFNQLNHLRKLKVGSTLNFPPLVN